jgi:hypothetical protein
MKIATSAMLGTGSGDLGSSSKHLALVPTPGPSAANPGHRLGKEPVEDDRTDEELKPIIVNLAEVRGIAAVRLIVVGVFLSSLLIPSRQLVNYMRNVWSVRGSMEMHQITDKRFVLEFSEEGDFEHVTKGGPWRYQKDAVLV